MRSATIASWVALAVITAPCVAQNQYSAELLVGTADQTLEVVDSTSGSANSVGIRGAYQFNSNVALEVAYQDYGEADDRYVDSEGYTLTTESRTTAVNVGAKGMLPFGNGFAVTGRAGLSFWNFELEYTDSAFPGEVWAPDDSGNDIYFGVGVQYDVNDNLFFAAEYTALTTDLSLEGLAVDLEVENFSLSVGGRF